jgi:predicted solute-binding protein
MYVNDYTRDWGEEGRKAVTALLERAYESGVIPSRPEVEYIVWT